MKILLASAVLLSLCSSAFASENDLIYSEGPHKGQSALASVGYYEMCFTGNAHAVRNKALDSMNQDIEKDGAFVRVDKKKNQLLISYVDTKCLDDSSDATAEGCRTWWSVPACKGL